MNSDPHDSNSREIDEVLLAAYALGQLGEKQRAAVEAKLSASEKARQFVEETFVLAGHLHEANRHGPSPQPSAALREAVEQRLSQLEESKMRTKDDPSLTTQPRRSRRTWSILAVAICLLVAAVPIYFATVGAQRTSSPGPVAMGPEVKASGREAGRRRAADGYYKKAKGDADRSGRMVDGDSQPGDLPAGRYDRKPNIVAQGNLPARRPEPAAPRYPSTDPARYSSDYSELGRARILADSSRPDAHRRASGTPAGSAPGYSAHSYGPSESLGEGDRAYRVASSEEQQRASKRGSYASGQSGLPVQGTGPVPLAPLAGKAAERRAAIDTYRSVAGAGWESAGERFRAEGHGGEGLGSEQYDAIVENPFLPAVGDAVVSTFSVDVDTASYANVRRFLNQDRLPPPDAVRIEEMVNYFTYDYPLPTGEVPFSVNMEVAQCPWNARHRLLRIGIKGQEIHREERGPSNLVFLLDVSGSMRGPNKLPLVKEAMKLLAKQLNEDDRVAIVTYASGTEVKLESTGGHQRQRIVDVIDSLTAGGSTHGSAGIQLAYQQAAEHFVEGGTNRVILATDGDLNVGITRDDELVKLIQEKAQSGVFLTVLGFGTGNLKDSKMEKLADRGNGAYAYIDSISEAHKVLAEQLTGSLVTIAKDVKIQIEFNPAEVNRYRLVGYENRLLPAPDFDDDTKDAGEIGAGLTVTALYEIVPGQAEQAAAGVSVDQGLKYQRPARPDLTKEAKSGELATLKLRYKRPDADQSRKLEFVVKDSAKRFGQASADFRFAAAVASFGMLLRGSQYAGDVTLSAVEEFAAGAVDGDPGSYRAEFVELVRRAKRLRGQ